MAQYALPILYTLFLWWFSTGVILYLDGLPRPTHRWTMLGASVVLALALWGVVQCRDETSVMGAYLGFSCGVLIWGWQEVGFLMGYLTGPRRLACPPGARGWSRFVFAVQTIWYHELALLGMAAAVYLLSADGANQIALKTYLLLWVMRLSAKLNLFFGVRNLSEEFLPEHLRYLASYYRRRSMNAFFPISVGLACAGALLLWRAAGAPDIPEAAAAGLIFLATLLTLAILEHALLMLPLPSMALWNWSLRSRRPEDSRPKDRDAAPRVGVAMVAAQKD